MVQVFVTEMPKTAEECPFYMDNNKKCNICRDKCCLNKEEECKHLMTFGIEFIEVDIPNE